MKIDKHGSDLNCVYLCNLWLKWGAAGEAGVDVVPPLEFVAFAELPAEQHDTTVTQRRKIDQTTLEVLELNSKPFQFRELSRQFIQNGRIRDTVRKAAAASFGCVRGFLCFVAVARDLSMLALDLPNDRANVGK